MTNHSKDNNSIVYRYKPNPLIAYHDNYVEQVLKQLPKFEFIKNTVELTDENWAIDKLFEYYNNLIITSLPPYLQRVLLEEVWGANNNKKSKSYIRSIWKGMGKLTPMTIIPTELILKNIIEKIDATGEEQVEILTQLNDLKTAVEKEMKRNVVYINIDGQTRSNCAIVPYIKGKFNLSDKEFIDEPIMKYNDELNEFDNIAIKTFDKLTKFQKGFFLSREISVNIIKKGNLKQVSDALIAINSNEKWTEWQTIFNNAEPTMLKSSIFEVMKDPSIRDFLLDKMNQSTAYKTKFSGWEWYVADNLSWLKHKKTINLDLLSDISKGKEKSPTKPQIDFVKDMMTNWINHYKSPKSIKPVVLQSYIAFRDVLKNWNTKNDLFYSSFSIPETNIRSEVRFLQWFLDTITKFESKVKKDKDDNDILNDAHWVKDSATGKHSAAPESWPAHCEGGMKAVSIKGRMIWLLDSLLNDRAMLEREGIVSSNTTMPDMSTLMVSNDMKDSNGNTIDQTADEVYEKGHMTSKVNEGDNDLPNLKPQPKSDNRSYGGKNNQINGVA